MTTTPPGGQTAGFRIVDLLKVFGATTDGVVAIDADQRIVGWNQGSTDLLGHRPEEVLGRRCDEILSWRDRCGEEVCGPDCPGPATAERGDVIATREVLGRSATGRRLWLNVTTVALPATVEGISLIHLLREVSLPPELERLIAERLRGDSDGGNGSAPTCEGADRLERLTPRERQVLHLLSDGCDTTEIARNFVISPVTVRNHVQNILNKLEVHSRLEAVALALRHESSRT